MNQKMIKWRKIEHPSYIALKKRFSWNKSFLKLLDKDKFFPFQSLLHMEIISK